jgi:hypothetical protein
LISYILKPFLKGVGYEHSNQIEALKIAEIFNELGYIVDIYDFNYPYEIKQTYDLYFGIGALFEKLVMQRKIDKKYIFYATGAYFGWANSAEIERIANLYKRKNVLVEPKRLVKKPTYFASQLSDAIITIGNDWTVSTYIYSKMPIYKVPVSVYNIKWKNSIKRDFNNYRKNFLWFGSSGLVHKGLDLCLEVFRDLPDYNLYICGPKEKDFFEIYRDELNLPNIHYLGFMDINSDDFRKIVEKCVFSIFPSCSEGQSGSVLTTMSTGLIPLITRYSGVDIDNKGFYIEADIDKIKNKVLEVSKIDVKELEELSFKNREYVKNFHSIENFKQKMKENLINILGE